MTEHGVSGSRGGPPLVDQLMLRLRTVTEAGWRRWDGAAVVLILVGLTVPALLGIPSRNGSLGAVLFFGGAAAIPIAVRRRWPLVVLGVVVAAAVVGTAVGVRFTPFVSNATPAVALVMYTVAVRFDRRVSLTALAVTFAAGWLAAAVAVAAHPEQDHNAVTSVLALGGSVVGDAVRTRRAYRTELALRRRNEADEWARRGLAEERLRISREVHDIVSHSLSVINVQAGVGRLVFDSQPDHARTALVEIEKVSGESLDELRHLLSAVRQSSPAGGAQEEDLAPTPGLGDLPSLVGQITSTGTEVSLDMERPRASLPPLLELSVYRIVQEALTNVVKHAGGARARVSIRPTKGRLTLEVVDDGPPGGSTVDGSFAVSEPRGGGWGLTGMRERAGLFGGTVTAEPIADGGFRVVASLPTNGPGAVGADDH